MPRLTTWAPFFFAHWFCPSGQCHHQKVFQTITWLLLSSNSPEPSGTYLWNLHQHTPEPSRTFREPSGTLRTFRKLPPEPTPALAGTLQNRSLHQHTLEHAPEPSAHRNSPEPSGTCTGTPRNFPELASGTYTSTHRNSPELSGTCPTPAHAGTLRNLPEQAPGT